MDRPELLVTIVWMLQTIISRRDARDLEFGLQVFRRYKVSSNASESSIFVSPPKTIKALPTSRLAWPTLGPGPSETVGIE